MTFTVLSAEFAHESNTFSRVPTGYDQFMARSFCLKGNRRLPRVATPIPSWPDSSTWRARMAGRFDTY